MQRNILSVVSFPEGAFFALGFAAGLGELEFQKALETFELRTRDAPFPQ
jgi:hypothetical protein